MKNGNILQELKTADKDFRRAGVIKEELETAMNEELEAASRSIKGKYKPMIKEVTEDLKGKRNRLVNLYDDIHKYGMFPTEDLLNCIAKFMSYVEGEDYTICESYICAGVIVRKDALEEIGSIDGDTLTEMYLNGDAVIIPGYPSPIIELYDSLGCQRYLVGNYTYLNEFFNRLIILRAQKGLRWHDLSPNTLFEFSSEFVDSHPDLLQRNEGKRRLYLQRKLNEVFQGE